MGPTPPALPPSPPALQGPRQERSGGHSDATGLPSLEAALPSPLPCPGAGKDLSPHRTRAWCVSPCGSRGRSQRGGDLPISATFRLGLNTVALTRWSPEGFVTTPDLSGLTPAPSGLGRSPEAAALGTGEPRAGPAAAPARSSSGLQPPASSRAAAKCCTARSDLSRLRLHTTAAFGRSPPTAGLQAFQTPLTRRCFSLQLAGGPGVGGLRCPRWGWRGEKLTPGQRNSSAVPEQRVQGKAPTAEGQDGDGRLRGPHPTNTRAIRRALPWQGTQLPTPSPNCSGFYLPHIPPTGI